MKNSYLGQSWLVILLSIFFGFTLSGVQAFLQEKIDTNKSNQSMRIVPTLVPGAVTGKSVTVGDLTVYEALNQNNKRAGWVIPARGQGFADKIEILIGLTPDASSLSGLSVLNQKETPGLGSRITESSWLSQFIGKGTTDSLTPTKNPVPSKNEIRAITGATISSFSICQIVNENVKKFRAELRKQQADP
ncbi:MAG: FMN-binding protein [Candidatus Aureabacteria bacterium]|nr:FMN-binding protein [Candidatus Auribacterota bacterium]